MKRPTPEIVTRWIGNCQICEGDFKCTEDGKVALHGYKRPGHGYIHGRCPGEGALAYERSRDLIPAIIEMYQREMDGYQDVLRAIDADKITSFLKETYSSKNPYVAVKKSEVTPDEWRWSLAEHRERSVRKLERAKQHRDHYQARYDRWTLRPLREIDEFGRTVEVKKAQEKRKEERQAARDVKAEKAAALARERGDKLIQRKKVLDGAGKLLREAGARGDREGALAVMRELGKKKNRSLLEASFLYSMDSVENLKKYGKLPADLPDLGWDKKPYAWEEDLHANDVLVAFGLAERDGNDVRYYPYYYLWKA